MITYLCAFTAVIIFAFTSSPCAKKSENIKQYRLCSSAAASLYTGQANQLCRQECCKQARRESLGHEQAGTSVSKEAVEYEAGFYYTIQKGDTLWDLSRQFFDSPWFWPDLWHENSQISNPHLIYPGECIRFFRREGIERLIKTLADQKVLQAKESQKQPPYYLYSAIERVGFIKKEPAVPHGSIFKVKDDKTLISKGDIVYIRQNESRSFTPGDKYTVYRTQPIRDNKTKTYIGIQHYLTGVVEITKKESHFTVATVVQSFRSIEINDFLMPHKQRLPKITLIENKKGLNGKIILSEEHESIIGDNTIAFIDKGKKDGVKQGQWYGIYYEDVSPAHVDFGTLLILHTERTTSTVLITSSEKSIYPGTRIHSSISYIH